MLSPKKLLLICMVMIHFLIFQVSMMGIFLLEKMHHFILFLFFLVHKV